MGQFFGHSEQCMTDVVLFVAEVLVPCEALELLDVSVLDETLDVSVLVVVDALEEVDDVVDEEEDEEEVRFFEDRSLTVPVVDPVVVVLV